MTAVECQLRMLPATITVPCFSVIRLIRAKAIRALVIVKGYINIIVQCAVPVK